MFEVQTKKNTECKRKLKGGADSEEDSEAESSDEELIYSRNKDKRNDLKEMCVNSFHLSLVISYTLLYQHILRTKCLHYCGGNNTKGVLFSFEVWVLFLEEG